MTPSICKCNRELKRGAGEGRVDVDAHASNLNVRHCDDEEPRKTALRGNREGYNVRAAAGLERATDAGFTLTLSSVVGRTAAPPNFHTRVLASLGSIGVLHRMGAVTQSRMVCSHVWHEKSRRIRCLPSRSR